MKNFKSASINFIIIGVIVLGTISYLVIQKTDFGLQIKKSASTILNKPTSEIDGIKNNLKRTDADTNTTNLNSNTTNSSVNTVKVSEVSDSVHQTNTNDEKNLTADSSCLGTISTQNTSTSLNSKALSIAKSFLLNRLGEKFYYCNISLKPNNGGPSNPWNKNDTNYLVYFDYKTPNTPISTVVQIIVDTSSGTAKIDTTNGIPDCKIDPLKCEVKITNTQASSIAESNGLRKGTTSIFSYFSKNDSFVWKVTEKNTSPCPLKTISIDSYSGRVLSTESSPCTPPPSSN